MQSVFLWMFGLAMATFVRAEEETEDLMDFGDGDGLSKSEVIGIIVLGWIAFGTYQLWQSLLSKNQMCPGKNGQRACGKTNQHCNCSVFAEIEKRFDTLENKVKYGFEKHSKELDTVYHGTSALEGIFGSPPTYAGPTHANISKPQDMAEIIAANQANARLAAQAVEASRQAAAQEAVEASRQAQLDAARSK